MRTIAIAAGGDSSEYGISVKSATEVSAVLSGIYNIYIVIIRGQNWYWEDEKGRAWSIDKNDFSLKLEERKIKFDAVFIAIHGTPGENGLLQGYFDMIKIPYTSCSAFTSALTFSKQATKLYLKEYGIPMAEAVLLRKGEESAAESVVEKLGLPCFIKPNDSGSSFGVSKVKKIEDIKPALESAFRESNEILIEAFMKGREFGCGVVITSARKIVLPVTEIISKNEFFDYEAKYSGGKSEEVTPARIDDELKERIQSLSSNIASILGCKGIVRVDFIVAGNTPLFLEINTVPGMTRESLVPQQAKAASIPLTELYSTVIEDLFR